MSDFELSSDRFIARHDFIGFSLLTVFRNCLVTSFPFIVGEDKIFLKKKCVNYVVCYNCQSYHYFRWSLKHC